MKLWLFRSLKESNDQSMRKSVRDKYMMNRDWLKKLENNRNANYNHFNLAKKAQHAKTQYNTKKNKEAKEKKEKKKIEETKKSSPKE